MKKLIFFLIFNFAFLNAQNILKFDKRNTQCEDKWVCYPMAKDSIYHFGFIYMDNVAGLTLRYEGSFKIDKNQTFNRVEKDTTKASSFKLIRLNPNKIAIAEIPEEKFNELRIVKTPSWMANYKENEDSVEFLYNKGFKYNGYQEIEIALKYLEKAEKMDPKFKGLQTELAYSYNALGKYDKAENALLKDLKANPNNCYTLKELAYTYSHAKKLDLATETYYKMTQNCLNNSSYIQETAFNLAFKYFEVKDKKNFEKWSIETKKWSTNENQFTNGIKQLEIEINK